MAFYLTPDSMNINRLDDGMYVTVNSSFTQIMGYDESDVIGKTSIDLNVWVDPDDRLRLIEGLRQHGSVTNLEALFRTKSGDIRYGLMSASVLQIESVPHIISITRDITTLKQAENQVVLQNAELVKRAMEISNANTKLKSALMNTVQLAMKLSEMRDLYTVGHERRVADLAVAISAEMGFDGSHQEGLRVAGWLHDVGKMTIPIEILSKPAKLGQIEYQLVQEHSQASYNVLKDVHFPWPVALIALQHHERINGSGYPHHLLGEEIIIEARILGVADVVEAMSSHRPYRPGLGVEAALAEIECYRGILYDTNVVDACLNLFRNKGYKLSDE